MAADSLSLPESSLGSMHLVFQNALDYAASLSSLVLVVAVFVCLCVCCLCRSGKERDVEPVPFTCLYIDSTWRDVAAVITWYVRSLMRRHKKASERESLLNNIRGLCHSTTSQHLQHPILVSSSLKTSLDLFFRVQKYLPGSEVIVTSMNARDTIQVLLHHGLHVIPLDVTREKLAPDVEALRQLISERTVAILISHLFGRLCDLSEVADIAHECGIHVLEDCSQACTTPVHSANPESDLVFFSFDVTHPCTAFGGAITRIKDKYLLDKMNELQESYPTGSEKRYVGKVCKCALIAITLNNPRVTVVATRLAKLVHIDLKGKISAYLTAPPSAGLVRLLREQPSTPMLFMLHRRLKCFNPTDFDKSRDVGDYVSERLPQVAGQIGMKALVRGYWLHPIIVDEPDEVIIRLNRLGIDAARQTAQIEFITSQSAIDSSENSLAVGMVGVDSSRSTPSTASFIMEHIIYLPVHKRVPRHHLDQICLAVEIVLNKLAILKRYQTTRHSGTAAAQKESRGATHPGPYGPATSSRKSKESVRKRTVSFNPSVTMVSQVPASSTGRSDSS